LPEPLLLTASLVFSLVVLCWCYSDSGGMMKLWNVKSSECVKSLAVSDDDNAAVWALAANTKEDHIITGASNSTLVLWKV